jgi:DNA uptake protein ComE-like DNA-binding protein
MKTHWKDYFIFSEKELKAIVVIGAFIIVSSSLSLFFPSKKKLTHLFYFDPNTIDSVSAIQLGCSSKQFTIVSNFRKKGGRFYTAKDIYKWYGVKQDLLNKLYPYVRIKAVPNSSNKYPIKGAKVSLLDINKAKIGDFERLGFVSTKLAERIIKYRSYLGGFSSLGQLQKVYGMNESLFRELRPYLSLEKGIGLKMHWNTMNYVQLEQLGLFDQREIWQILRDRKERRMSKSWIEIVEQYDLSREQANILKAKTDIK